ncbi:MAG: glycogen debranching protein GlgX [Thermomicrobiales bacterium]|nr:glycogen debranching protein GlgX [Thermomicrobiales bacterium]
MSRKQRPGSPYPLGATWDGRGTNFAIYSENAQGMVLCLFNLDDPTHETERVSLTEVTAHVWHIWLSDIGPGQLYGFRAEGEYAPKRGLRFNANKLLIDPYAKAITGRVDWNAPVFGYEPQHPDKDLSFDANDDAWGMPKAVVIDPAFNWGDDAPLRIPWQDSIIYETHVKGFSATHPEIPEDIRGTYLALAHPAAIKYLTDLGITAVELLPVHGFLDDHRLVERGLSNYWGYNTLTYFAPEARYACGDRGRQVYDFKHMVRALHAAGIEVILDVVYNHTAEGSELGPTLSLRGLDNPTYYRVDADNPRYYVDYTGTGNSLDARNPQVLQLIMDSLRYWVNDMHVDGFRFDLAATLARELHDVDRLSAFFDIIHQDPVISQVKLIAEPWDVGEGGYQVGNFPVLWTEWNGKYRDTVRHFWRGDMGKMADLAYRLTGSSDLYQSDGRKPYASINFITAHDGFTLADLVSYNDKHNLANGEDNRDGTNDNISWNGGAEGPTDDPAIVALRAQQQRNLLATLLLSQGVPMLTGGDEIGRTQHGNNNAYCQDNDISWYDWNLTESDTILLAYVRDLIAFRKKHPVLRRRRFFQGRRVQGSDVRDITWIRPDGGEMSDTEWQEGWIKSLGMRLGGDALNEVDENGDAIVDDTLLILLSAYDQPIDFVMPGFKPDVVWEHIFDTSEVDGVGKPEEYRVGESYSLAGRSIAVLRRKD